MDSDSDRTIDSDELEEIIALSKKEKSTNNREKKTPVKVHAISDSESDDEEIEVKKVTVKEKAKNTEKSVKEKAKNTEKSVIATKRKIDDRPRCHYGSKCYRKNPEHRRDFYHPGSISHITEHNKCIQQNI